jgi:hypothetical protein
MQLRTPHLCYERSKTASDLEAFFEKWTTRKRIYMRFGWHRTIRRIIYIILWKAEWESWIRYRYFVRKRTTSAAKWVEYFRHIIST